MKVMGRSYGQSLIELLVAIALAAVILPGLLTGLVASREGKAQEIQRDHAIALIQEAEDAVRSVRDGGWTTFAINGTYHPTTNGMIWSLASGSETVNGFTRSIEIADVSRDGSGAITHTGGSVDPSTKEVTITISWTTPRATSTQLVLYLTRYKDNLPYIETTEADFNNGTHTGTAVTNTSGGEVILGSGGAGDWCAPDLTLATLDLPKSGVANALTAIEGQAFAGTGENASGVSFANVTINNTSPPSASIAGTYDCCKTNAIFGESGYVYLATDTNTKEVAIMNIGSSPYAESGYFNAPGNGNGNSIFVLGNIGYMTAGNKLYSFDLSSKSGSRPQLGSVSLAATGNKIYVVGSYAYVAIQSTTTQLQIVDVSNPSSMSIVGSASLSGQEGKDVFVNSTGTRAYLVTATSASKREFFIINTETKSGSRGAIGSYDTSGMNPKGVTVVSGNKAIAVGIGGEEYQVINIANESSPTRCGGIEVDSGVNGVSSVIEADGDAYSYIITGDSSSELKIIAGGPGGQYASSGTYESQTFERGYQTAFNRLWLNYDKPNQTDIQFQVAVADTIAGSCAGVTFSYVGPDKTNGTFFTEDSFVPLDDDGSGYENPGRCMRYKAFFSTTDSTQTPVLYDFTINYSP